MNDSLRILRYNTGTDKKAFVQFKDKFDAAIFNATIVAYSGASIADLVSMHARKYIIDPQTHIFQQEISSIMVHNKKTGAIYIKKSVEKYFESLPQAMVNIITNSKRPLNASEVTHNLDALVESVYKFQTEFVNSYIKDKDYGKYLKYAKAEPEPKLIVAPYFMIKDSYSEAIQKEWFDINKTALQKTITINQQVHPRIPIAAQLVLDKQILLTPSLLENVKNTYDFDGYEYIFLWIDDFNCFTVDADCMKAFSGLVGILNSIGKKPAMAYGGYESIILCNQQSPFRLFGVAQSVGYGEYRNITPVGGGMPVNKYYFYPLHQRLKFDNAAQILSSHGYFSDDITPERHAHDYYENICNCQQCRLTIGDNINNFVRYNDSIPFQIPTKSGPPIVRNRPTADATLISAIHFLYCKVKEWDTVSKEPFSSLIEALKADYQQYAPTELDRIKTWCNVYDCKRN